MVWRKRIILNEASLTMPSGETEDMHKKFRGEFEKTLDMFPNEMKQEYSEAKKLCPLLVEKESDPVAFLRREDFTALAAVLRFVMYWKTRKQVFGERFSHPMTLGPDGVFDREEVDFFATGYMTLLPPDPDGSPVLFFNFGRHSSLPPIQTLTRHTFYLCQAASANPASQKQGLVFIFVVSDQLLRELVSFCKDPIEVLKKALPMKVKKKYFVPGYNNTNEGALKSIESNLSTVLDRAAFPDGVALPVFGDDPKQLASKLESYGFSLDALPTAIGGNWSWSHFSKWLISNGHKDRGQPLDSPAIESDNVASLKKTHPDYYEHPPLSSSPPPAAIHIPGPSHDLLHQVLEHIPRDEILDYLEAKMRVPALVEHESPFSRFLDCENNNALLAAKRLAAYWHQRRECYGERAFLPLNISGQGALTQDDMGTLVSGSMFLLPDDRIGRPVLCLDLTRHQQKDDFSSALRIWFYCLHVASENSKAQFEGIVCLCILSKSHNTSNGIGASAVGEKFITALPVRLNMVHVLLPDEPLSWTGNLDFDIPTQLPFIGNIRSDMIAVSAGDNILSRLDAYGIKKARLPIKVGGTWDHYADLKFWLNQRSNQESEEFKELVTNHSEGIYGVEEADSVEEPSEATAGDLGSKGHKDDVSEEDESPYMCNGLDGFTETKEIMAKGLSEMEDAVSMLPLEEKAALLEAREKVPELAKKEAPPIQHLRFENYNAWAAAQRLALYWRTRKRVFGDRYLLPMNLSGEGTLTRDDVAALSSGYCVFLPYDKCGRTCIAYDPERLTDRSGDTRSRMIFYLWNIIAENPMSQQEGVKIIIIQRSSKVDQAAKKPLGVVLELPVRWESVHIVNCPHDSEKSTFLESLVPAFLRLIGFLEKKSNVHAAATKEELLEKLVKHDLISDGIPECLGGNWNYDTFSHWMELRTRYEWDLPVSGKKSKSLPHIPPYNAKPRSQLTDEEKVERKRRLNVLNSRRKRERVKVEVEVFHEQVADLRKQNRELRVESRRLEESLAAAREEVAKAERAGSESPEDSQPPPPAAAAAATYSSPDNDNSNQTPAGMSSLNSTLIQEAIEQRMLQEMIRDQARNALLRDIAPDVLAQLSRTIPNQQILDQSAAAGSGQAMAGIGQGNSLPSDSLAQQLAYAQGGSKRKRSSSPKPNI